MSMLDTVSGQVDVSVLDKVCLLVDPRGVWVWDTVWVQLVRTVLHPVGWM